MAFKLLISLVVCVLVGFLGWFVVGQVYVANNYGIFASEEAQTSLEVTEAQTAELERARNICDALAHGFMGALICGLAGALANSSSSTKSAMIAAGAGLVLGFAAGTAGGFIGRWITVPPTDAMMAWAMRWAIVLTPTVLTAAFCGALAGNLKTDFADALKGGVLALAGIVILYSLLSGSVTRNEERAAVFPGHSENRLLVLQLSTIGVVLGVGSQLAGKSTGDEPQNGVDSADKAVEANSNSR